jgi:RHS repeat-associated protein
LQRTTPDAGGVWTYAQVKDAGAASTTTVTDPSGNQTVIQFQGLYETQRQAYQGTAGGTLLQTANSCYATAAPPCTTAAVTLPIELRTLTATVPGTGGLQSQHTDKFDVFGNLTESDDYDFATAVPFPLLRQTLISYNTSLGANLNAYTQTVTVKDGSGNIKSRQDTSYDQYSGFTGVNCISGAPQHDDSGHGCTFTARANVTSITTYTDPVTPGGAITKNFTYDSLGNLRTAQLNCCQNKSWSFSNTTSYAYPDSVTSGTSSPQLTTSYTYDPHTGLVLTSRDGNNLTTTLTYDSLGRTLSSQTGSLPATTYTYIDSGTWSVKVCAPVQGTNVACQKSILDNQGRTVTTQVLDGNGTLYSATDTQYDSFGRAFKNSNPYTTSASYWTQIYFDALNRVYKTTLPGNSAATISFADNTATYTDPALKQRKAVINGLGQLSSVYEPDPSNGNTLTLQSSYAYNVFGQLTKVTQSAQTRSYSYDALGRLLSSTTPEGGTTCFGSVTGSTCNTDGYDNFNNLLKRTDARGVLTSYSYDSLNRLNGISYTVTGTTAQATPSVSLTYGIDSSCASAHGAGCIGQVITMTDGPGSENYTYNALEQMTQLQKVIGSTTYTLQYAYDLASELAQITYPSGHVIQQSVDAIGRLCEIAPSTTGCGTATSPYATGYSYNVANQATGFKYGNGIYASLGFSPDRLQLNCLDYSTTNRNGTCIHDTTTKFGLTYSYGAAGSNDGLIGGITDSVDNGRSVTYTYDALSRLSSALTVGSSNYAQWGLSWGYDPYGNRLNQTQTAGSVYQGSLQVTQATNRINCIGGSGQSCTGGVVPTYDLSGNMTYDGTNTLVYDAENKTVSATNQSASGTYTYDGNGLRVKRVSGSTTTVYVFSGSKVIAEYDNGAALTAPSREYIYGGSALLAKIDSSGTKYYHHDHLSNRVVTSSTGAILEQMGHYPFGDAWYNASSDNLIFTSYERDSESSNDYAQARFYRWLLGRFLSLDPLSGSTSDPQSLNRYTYVENNPIGLVDPSGMMEDEVDDDWGGGGGGGGWCWDPACYGTGTLDGPGFWNPGFSQPRNSSPCLAGCGYNPHGYLQQTPPTLSFSIEGVLGTMDEACSAANDYVGCGDGFTFGSLFTTSSFGDLIPTGPVGGGGNDISKAREIARKVLTGDNDCSKFFNNSPLVVISANSNIPGNFTTAAQFLATDTITDTPTTLTGDAWPSDGAAQVSNTYAGPGATIAINPDGAFHFLQFGPNMRPITIGRSFVSGSPAAGVEIILHELAHTLLGIPGDANSESQSQNNTKTIDDNCYEAILRAL